MDSMNQGKYTMFDSFVSVNTNRYQNYMSTYQVSTVKFFFFFVFQGQHYAISSEKGEGVLPATYGDG
jgi:hypothetical protein